MRSTVWKLLILTAAIPLINARPASAQDPNGCYTTWTQQQCPIPNGSCSKIVYYATPTVGYGWVYIWQNTTCCGDIVQIPYDFVDQCLVTQLRDPVGAEKLVALSKQMDLLIPGCDGYLRRLPANLVFRKPGSGRPDPALPLLDRPRPLVLGTTSGQ